MTQIVEVIKNTKGESKGSGKAKGGAVFWAGCKKGLAMLGLIGGEKDVSDVCFKHCILYFW